MKKGSIKMKKDSKVLFEDFNDSKRYSIEKSSTL